MECIQHFSHEHPLSFFQADDEDPRPYECRICGLPILSSPSYTCSIDTNCNFFLHKVCTQLPQEFYHDGHLDTLKLELARGYDSSRHIFNYNCRNYSNCGFELHPLVVKPVEIKSQHRSHRSHPLVALCRKMVCVCDACGEGQSGLFFHCEVCNFWIHQDCTILPAILKISNFPHPFILTYDPPFSATSNRIRCRICQGLWPLRYNGVYFCGITYQMVHVACAKSQMENLQTETIQEFIQLPDEKNTFPSLVIRRSAEQNGDQVKEVSHKHPLILQKHGSNMSSSSSDLVCDVCIQPIDHMISSPFYRCQSDGCPFLAHHFCVNHLPTRLTFIEFPISIRGDLFYSDGNFFNSIFPCIFCNRPSNGFAYKVLADDQAFMGYCDVECASAPISIKHASHGQHPLFRLIRYWKNSNPLSCCSDESLFLDTYRCVVCDFTIHIRCALLPKTTRHKFDKHPLELIMRRHDHNEENMTHAVFCEFCEQEIELKLWYYGCHKCEQYFHINCIPSVGYLSKVKFGRNFADDSIHLNHPLTLTQMLTHGTHERCAVCNKIIDASADQEMALHCSACHFWIHFSCAPASMHYFQLLKRNREVLIILQKHRLLI